MDTFPSGAAKLAVVCPHCQTTSAVQYPDPDHVGDIKAECGHCQRAFTFASPHGSATEQVSVGDGGTSVGG